MQNDYQKQCHSERSEESRVHKVGVTEILRYALDDKMIGNFYYDTPSFLANNYIVLADHTTTKSLRYISVSKAS